jgi:hypothetical protein
MIDRSKLRRDGPPSQRLATGAILIGAVLMGAAAPLWLLGAAGAGNAAAAVGSGLGTVMLFTALAVERGERRRERVSGDNAA